MPRLVLKGGRHKNLNGLVFGNVLAVLAVLSLVLLSVLASPSVPASMTSAVQRAWPMFHQNAQHTGLSPFPGPTVPVPKWRFQTGGPIDSPPAIGRGRIYVASEDGKLYALNLHGDLLWTFQTGYPIKTSPAIGLNGIVYLASCIQCGHYNRSAPPEGILYALNPAGQLKWNLTIPNSGEGVDTLSSPTIGPDGTIYVGSGDGSLYAIS